MLFKEHELEYITEGTSILESCQYLNESESRISTKHIPVFENSRLGVAVVDFKDVESLAESEGISYIDAMGKIAKVNEIEEQNLAVSVDEAVIIETPELVEKLHNVVARPISEHSAAYKFANWAMTSFIESGNAGYLDVFLNEEDSEATTEGNGNGEGIWTKIKAKLASIKNSVTESKPVQWISQKLAALKSWFAKKWNWLKEKVKNNSVLNKIKNAVESAINWLKEKLTAAKNKIKGAFSSKDKKEAPAEA